MAAGLARAEALRPGPHRPDRPAPRRHRNGDGFPGRARRPARLGDHEPPGQGLIRSRAAGPFFAVRVKSASGPGLDARSARTGRALSVRRRPSGVNKATNPNLPAFREASFDASYPFGIVNLSDPALPVKVRIKAWNPLIPTDAEPERHPHRRPHATRSSTRASQDLDVAVCGTLQNFIGGDGSKLGQDWKSDPITPSRRTATSFAGATRVQGLFMKSETASTLGRRDLGHDGPDRPPVRGPRPSRTSWLGSGLGHVAPRFLGRFPGRRPTSIRARSQGRRAPGLAGRPGPACRPGRETGVPLLRHLAASPTGGLVARASRTPPAAITTRLAWTPRPGTRPRRPSPGWPRWKTRPSCFRPGVPGERPARAVVKEAALFNLSTLRTQTCFRTEDGRFYAWEGCGDKEGCCWGSCTHVWNYEQAVGLPVRTGGPVPAGDRVRTRDRRRRADELPGEAPARRPRLGQGRRRRPDGLHHEDVPRLAAFGRRGDAPALWPKVRKALEFCWIQGGWDADKDGVMEGCQHNTMDVEYYGPNPQMGLWYLGALRAAEEMARGVGDAAFAKTCRALFENGQPLDRRQPLQRPLLHPQGRPAR